MIKDFYFGEFLANGYDNLDIKIENINVRFEHEHENP
jgi:hypothetical protein